MVFMGIGNKFFLDIKVFGEWMLSVLFIGRVVCIWVFVVVLFFEYVGFFFFGFLLGVCFLFVCVEEEVWDLDVK